MYTVKASPGKNRLYLTLKGKLDVAQMQAGVQAIVVEVKKLKPGFAVISDIAEAQPNSEEARLVMQQAMGTIKQMGMGRAVRVVSDSAMIAANQWQRTSRSAAGYTAEQVRTVEEAEHLLDQG